MASVPERRVIRVPLIVVVVTSLIALSVVPLVLLETVFFISARENVEAESVLLTRSILESSQRHLAAILNSYDTEVSRHSGPEDPSLAQKAVALAEDVGQLLGYGEEVLHILGVRERCADIHRDNPLRAHFAHYRYRQIVRYPPVHQQFSGQFHR